jgi:hypothetical protein
LFFREVHNVILFSAHDARRDFWDLTQFSD